MYVCMYVCMYVLYAYICVCIHLCVYACMYICMHVCMHVCVHTCMYIYHFQVGFERYGGIVLVGRGNWPGELSRGELSRGKCPGPLVSRVFQSPLAELGVLPSPVLAAYLHMTMMMMMMMMMMAMMMKPTL